MISSQVAAEDPVCDVLDAGTLDPARGAVPARVGVATRNSYSRRAERARDRELSEQAEVAYCRLVTDWKASNANKTVATT